MVTFPLRMRCVCRAQLFSKTSDIALLPISHVRIYSRSLPWCCKFLRERGLYVSPPRCVWGKWEKRRTLPKMLIAGGATSAESY